MMLQAPKTDRVFYTPFKYGGGAQQKDERFFLPYQWTALATDRKSASVSQTVESLANG